VVEGEDPLPRRDPPYVRGLFATGTQMGWFAHTGSGVARPPAANPTLVNNVGTLATVPHILRRGAEWYRSLGTRASAGTMVFTVVGDVARPGYGELELGLPLGEVIDIVGGGPRPGHTIKAVFSGVANPVITSGQLDAPASYEGLRKIGSGLGAAGFIVYDDSADMVSVARMFSRFLYVESCGQCLACKLNSRIITSSLESLEAGKGTVRDVEVIGSRLRKVTDLSRCYLPTEEQVVISSILRTFPEEFVDRLERPTRITRSYQLPKIVEIADGRVIYDDRIAAKQPDWTYDRQMLAG
jgi:NADH-quinone oxidoreductase subunit F